MLINKETYITGKSVILVPYKKEHVNKYHNWMKSEELQHLTASEPLTLEEEYEMQKSWSADENKCTFIVLNKKCFDDTQNEIESMIGDTNLFFASPHDRMVAEAEIMIAENWARGQHCGWEAIILMLLYGIETLGVKQFVVKVTVDNQVSINMFGKLGFQETGRSEVFQEVTLNKVVDEVWTKCLISNVGEFVVVNKGEEFL